MNHSGDHSLQQMPLDETSVRSATRRLRTAPSHEPTSALSTDATTDASRPLPKGRRFAWWMRWLHIYLSMLGLVALLFFSVTGITLNHPDWFTLSEPSIISAHGQLNVTWLGSDASTSGSERSSTDAIDRLAVVECLRREHAIHGAVAEFTTDDRQCMVTFKAPGYAADAFIERATGAYELTETRLGWVAIINDLHKGRDSGSAWRGLIDVTAGLCCILSLTGLILLLYLKRRRWSGLAVGAVGGLVMVAIFWWCVP